MPRARSVKASADKESGSPYERLQQAITTGEIQPGEQLIELVLAREFEISRTPIREALIRLEQDGLAVRGPYGLRVREITPEQILDLYDARITLEGKAAAVAAERRTEHDLVRMKHAAQRAREVDATDRVALSQTNRAFHQAVAHASHNEALVDLLERMNMQLGAYSGTTLVYPGRLKVANQQHVRLIQAIENRDSERASKIATEHFDDARKVRLAMWPDE